MFLLKVGLASHSTLSLHLGEKISFFPLSLVGRGVGEGENKNKYRFNAI
jgi:hypothetical protein